MRLHAAAMLSPKGLQLTSCSFLIDALRIDGMAGLGSRLRRYRSKALPDARAAKAGNRPRMRGEASTRDAAQRLLHSEPAVRARSRHAPLTASAPYRCDCASFCTRSKSEQEPITDRGGTAAIGLFDSGRCDSPLSLLCRRRSRASAKPFYYACEVLPRQARVERQRRAASMLTVRTVRISLIVSVYRRRNHPASSRLASIAPRHASTEATHWNVASRIGRRAPIPRMQGTAARSSASF